MQKIDNAWFRRLPQAGVIVNVLCNNEKPLGICWHVCAGSKNIIVIDY